ncbi:chemotaxis protein CheB [Xylophilus sp. GOD-11R]|uniref:chemotaxis protein CheB n=1 Tax=Xylophilus sp. GOD-11R TaxID=3089814 RepID=UPI00298CC273|nr:chemotaxis protein CheB [Xylophilus sp. GOD-11R]WPB55138.1 chemotaxis protein CheB [Xylophilus sp. GOD-11R]
MSPPDSPPAARAIEAVAVGASAGGVAALLRLFSALHAGFRLPIFTVLHMPDDHDSGLADLFAMRLPIAVREAADKMPIEPATLYFAPPGYHLQVEADHVFSLSCDSPVFFSRPSIDILFDSAAYAYGNRLAALLLTGASEDGAAGLATVGRLGGFTAVQDPADAQIATMPQAAIDRRRPDLVLPLTALQTLLLDLDANGRPDTRPAAPKARP